MSSALSFTFRPSLIPAYAQAEFLTRVFQLALDYETLTAPVPEAPPADTLPMPSFVPVQGDGADGESAPAKKPRKNPWAGLSEEQRADRLAAMKRGRAEKAAARRQSADSLEAPVPPTEAAPARLGTDVSNLGPAPPAEAVPATLPVEDAASETSSKKARKSPWADLTPEQRAAKIAAMQAGKVAKKAARQLLSVYPVPATLTADSV